MSPPFAFLSYSSQDIEFARKLARDLKAAGVPIFFADTDNPNNSDIPPGGAWDVELQKALSDCTCLMVVLSPTAAESKNVGDEFGMVLDRGKFVFPLLYRECTIPLRLNRLQRTDLQGGNYRAGLARLVSALKEKLGTPAAAPGAPSAKGAIENLSVGETRAIPAAPEAPSVKEIGEAELSDAGQAIAWESLRAHFWPEPVSNGVAMEVIRGQDFNRRKLRDPSLQDSQKMPEARARDLIGRLIQVEFIRRRPDQSVEVVKPSNAMKSAAYLQVEQFGADRAYWDRLLSDARQKLAAAPTEERRANILDFLAALRKVGKLRAEALKIPSAVFDDLDQIINRKPLQEAEEYFVNFVRRWGVPEGLGKISADEAKGRVSVRITRRNGRVIRLESINGAGALAPRQGSSLAYLGSENATPQQAECRWEFSYDEAGSVVLEEASNSAGRLLYRCSYDNSQGQRQAMARYFIDSSDVVHPRTRSGASFVRITRDERGFDRQFEYLDGFGVRQPDEIGRFGQQVEIGPLGLAVRITCLGPDMKPAPCRKGYVSVALAYDERGNLRSQSYFDSSNQPVSHADGYHNATFAWNERDNWTGVRLFDAQSGPAVFAPDGFSGWDARYDELGNQIGQTYLDAQSKPVVIQAAYAGWSGVCDAQGRLIDQTYLDAAGNPTPNREGVIRTVYQFDTAGNMLEFAYRDAAGHPAADFQGIARYTQKLDERGLAISGFYYGLDGQPIRNKEGYAGFQATYDAHGNQTEFVFLSPVGVPDWGKAGYARQKLVFDSRGNILEELFFSPSGEAAEDTDGVHHKVHAYDQHGNVVSTRRFNAADQAAIVDGYSITTQTYDPVSGNVLSREYRDASGQLTLNCSGYAVESLKYDSCSRQIEARYLDRAKNLVRRNDGTAGWQAYYDARGLMIDRCNFDASGHPAPSQNGVMRWRAVYDARGNRTQLVYVDLDGHLALSGQGLAAILYDYDSRGNRVRESYIGLDKNLVVLNTGIAGIVWTYDQRDNQIEQIYFDAAQHRAVHQTYGYASWRAIYDGRGNRISQEFLGTEGQFVANSDGFVRILTEYDDRNRPFRERKFTLKTEERPEEIYETLTQYDFQRGREEVFRSPRHQITSGYDRFGRQISEAWFLPDGSPEMTRENEIAFSRWQASFGPCSRLAQKTYFDGARAVVRDVKFDYDADGNEIGKLLQDREDQHWRIEKQTLSPEGRTVEIALYSPDGKSAVADAFGRARWVERYDGEGNRIEVAYFDVNGALTPYYGHLRATATYDATNRVAKATYLIPYGGGDTLQKSFTFKPDELALVHLESIGPDGSKQLNDAFVLEYRMKAGDVSHCSTTIDAGPEQQQLHMVQRCTAVNPDGSYEISVEAGDPGQVITMTMARSGRILKTSLREPLPQPWFPTHPIFAGESWRQQIPFGLQNPFTGQSWEVPLTYSYTLAEVAQVDGRRVARIKVEVPPTAFGIGSEVTVTIDITGENKFDLDRGLQVSSNVSSHVIYVVLKQVEENRVSASLVYQET